MKNDTFKIFREIMETAIAKNILTNEALKSSELYDDYWLAAADVAQVIVRCNPKYAGNISSFLGYEFKDFVQELTVRLVNKFETQINAILNKGLENHNYNAYCTSIFRSYTHDVYKKAIIKDNEETTDENGKIHNTLTPVTKKDEFDNDTKLTYSFILLSTPLSSEETDGAEFGSMIPSEELTPEENVLFTEAIKESAEHIFSYFEHLGHRKSRGPLFALANLCLKLEEDKRAQNLVHRLSIACDENPEYFVRLYNKEMKRLADTLQISQKRMKPFLATNLSDFGKDFHPGTSADIAAHLSRFRYKYKVELAKLKDIDLGPKQVRRKKKELVK